ncbi:MAG: ferritin [Clostridium sp.]|jgi:ferritin|nr:ferritin [Clostridium sp.]
MLSKNLIDAINDQINYELLSSYLYLSMTAYCEDNDFPGAANFYRIQAKEEVDHAMKFYDYLIERDARVVLKGFEDPQVEFDGYKDTFEKSLEHEKSVTSRIYTLMDIAMEEREHATISFLKWYVDEQVEEESNFNAILGKIKRAELNPAALYMLDDELLARVYIPAPAE